MRGPRELRSFATICALALCACSQSTIDFSEQPIELELAGPGGGLLGLGTAGERTQPFPLLVDTGSPLTAFSDGTGSARAMRGSLVLYGTGAIPRLELDDTQLFVTPLGGTGLDQSSPIGGVLGGDNLQRFPLDVRYQPTPRISLLNQIILTDCEVSERCGAVLPFSLAGGRQRIDLGDDLYAYPASYVLLDGCVEPALDPLDAGIECKSPESCGDPSSCDVLADAARLACQQGIASCRALANRYMPQGIDVRFAIATGFPGLALTASAYDRLRGRGSAQALLAAAAHTLFMPDQSISATGITVGVTTLGTDTATMSAALPLAGVALVHPDGYFGACATLARSRRLRKDPPEVSAPPNEATCLRSHQRNPDDALLTACDSETNGSGGCDDATPQAHTHAYVELAGAVPVIVVPDTISLLQSINADVRPESATVEGVIGTELLRRLGTTIDYPGNRVITTCADASCRAFPASGHGTDCARPSGELLFGGGSARTFTGGGCAIP